MGTEVLRPYDSLIERIWLPPATVFPRRRNFYNNYSYNYHYNSHPTKPTRSKPEPALAPARFDHKRKSSDPSPIQSRYSSDDLKQSKNNHSHNRNHQLVKGQVTILRRGEVLDLKPQTAKASAGNDPKTGNRSRSLSPKPVSGGLPDVYAGLAISVSPSPESLPLPSFSKKKQVPMTVDDSATRDLRRLLRLD